MSKKFCSVIADPFTKHRLAQKFADSSKERSTFYNWASIIEKLAPRVSL